MTKPLNVCSVVGMKLVNPTDEELNAAFAEHVAEAFLPNDGLFGFAGPWKFKGSREVLQGFDAIPRYTQSTDAVLPWLEKCPYWAVDGGPNKPWMVLAGAGEAEADTFPRAAVIALLRANGVQVEFTT